MEQSYQIYIKVPEVFKQKVGNTTSNVIGLYAEFMIRVNVVRELKALYDFHVKLKQGHCSVFGKNKVCNDEDDVYSLVLGDGGYYGKFVSPNEIGKNPLLGYTISGITIIDVSEGGQFRYAFLFLDELKPLSSSEYLEYYYSSNYGCYEQKKLETLKKATKDIPVLTEKQVRKILPAMYLKKIVGVK